MKRITAVFLCLAMMLGLLAGCAGETEEAYVPTGDALVMEEEEVVEKAYDDGTQTLSLVYYPEESMNPLACWNQTNRVVLSLMYQGLFAVNRENEAVPVLCQSYTISPDMRTYEFTLDPRATFSDGTPLTADDVKMSLDEAWDSTYYGGRFTHVDYIYPHDNDTLIIGMKVPFGDLPLLLDIPIIKNASDWGEFPLGTGPYVLNGAEGSRYLSRRNNWWCESDDLIVFANRISLKEAQDEVDVRDAFEFENVGVVCTDPGSDRYVEYRCDYELWDCESGIFLYLGYNLGSTMFKNTALRQAVIRGIDRQTLADKFYRGFAMPAQLPASPNSQFYSQALAQNYAYNKDSFVSMVASSGAPGWTVRLLVNADDSLRVKVAQEISIMLNASGMLVSVVAKSGDDYRTALREGEYDIYLGQTRLSANMDLSPFFSASGRLNYGGIANISTYTQCLAALENEGNYYALHQSVMDGALLCPILFRSYAVYASRGLLTDLQPARDNVFCHSIK